MLQLWGKGCQVPDAVHSIEGHGSDAGELHSYGQAAAAAVWQVKLPKTTQRGQSTYTDSWHWVGEPHSCIQLSCLCCFGVECCQGLHAPEAEVCHGWQLQHDLQQLLKVKRVVHDCIHVLRVDEAAAGGNAYPVPAAGSAAGPLADGDALDQRGQGSLKVLVDQTNCRPLCTMHIL